MSDKSENVQMGPVEVVQEIEVLVLTEPTDAAPIGVASVEKIPADFDGLYEVIGCQTVQPIGGRGSWCGWVDEDGYPKLRRPNQRATALVHALGWPGITYLAGTVVISGPMDKVGNPTDVPADVMQVFNATVPRQR